jgi:hypothetical protein
MNMMSPFGTARSKRLSFRTVFIADTYLGTRGSYTDFLRRTAGDNLFLVSHIIKGWRLLMMHSDKFDSAVRSARFLALLGGCALTASFTWRFSQADSD